MGCLVATGLVATGFCCVATGPVEYTTELGIVMLKSTQIVLMVYRPIELWCGAVDRKATCFWS